MFHALIQKYQGKGVGWWKGSEEENLFSGKGEGVYDPFLVTLLSK